jgi:hypothetical protein
MGFIITQDQLRNAPPESPKNAYRRGYQQGAYAALQSVEAVLGGHQTAQIAQFGPGRTPNCANCAVWSYTLSCAVFVDVPTVARVVHRCW